MAMDTAWVKVYHKEVAETFKGECVTLSVNARRYGWRPTRMRNYGNSGAAAIALAMMRGARTVILLGYDCQHTGGKAHHHEDHPQGLKNATGCKVWPQHFAEVGREAKDRGVLILNASRETALECFPRVDLETALGDYC